MRQIASAAAVYLPKHKPSSTLSSLILASVSGWPGAGWRMSASFKTILLGLKNVHDTIETLGDSVGILVFDLFFVSHYLQGYRSDIWVAFIRAGLVLERQIILQLRKKKKKRMVEYFHTGHSWFIDIEELDQISTIVWWQNQTWNPHP